MTEETSDGRDVKEPVAGLSAASSCIRLSLTTTTSSSLPSFRPVYTHQCFGEGECIEGWRPFLEAERQSHEIYRTWKLDDGCGRAADVVDDGIERGGGEIHISYLHCPPSSASERIDAHIILSPSCDGCRIEVRTTTAHDNNTDRGGGGAEEPIAKKAKTVSFHLPAEPYDAQQQTKEVGVTDVIRKLSLAVPPIASVGVNGVDRTELVPTTTADVGATRSNALGGGGCLPTPLGRILRTYHRKVKGAGGGGSDGSSEEIVAKFVLTLADGSDPEVAEYHNSIQPLARWFIETADDVDLADVSRGYWRVMYLFRYLDPPPSSSESSTSFGLAGYFTLFHFKSPFRKPRPGIIVRVCQALILPPYHRAGHGSIMLTSVHDYANDTIIEDASSGMEIVEINVEDPAPAFVALRDAVDYQRYTSTEKDRTIRSMGRQHDVTKKDFFEVSEEDLLSVAECMKITKRQALIMHHVWKCQQIMKWKQSLSSDDEAIGDDKLIQDVETNYRLMVKKSLRTLRQEELGAYKKEGQKILLGQWFDETMCHYHRILKTTTSPINNRS